MKKKVLLIGANSVSLRAEFEHQLATRLAREVTVKPVVDIPDALNLAFDDVELIVLRLTDENAGEVGRIGKLKEVYPGVRVAAVAAHRKLGSAAEKNGAGYINMHSSSVYRELAVYLRS